MSIKIQQTKCKITGDKIPVLFNFGKMPIANNFSRAVNMKNSYDMKIAFNKKNGVFQLVDAPKPKKLFNKIDGIKILEKKDSKANPNYYAISIIFENNSKIFTDLDVFYSFYKNKSITVTGTNGKSTTANVFSVLNNTSHI